MSNAPGLPGHYAKRREFYQNVILERIAVSKPEVRFTDGVRRDITVYSINLGLAVRVGQFDPAILTDLARRLRPRFGPHFSIHLGSRTEAAGQPPLGEALSVSFTAAPEAMQHWVEEMGLSDWQADWRYNDPIMPDEQRLRRMQELRPAVEAWLLFRSEEFHA